MHFYLQISKLLIAMFLATSPNKWVIHVQPTTYINSHGDTIYVADRRWIDTLLQGVILDSSSAQPPSTTLGAYEVKVVYIHDSNIVH